MTLEPLLVAYSVSDTLPHPTWKIRELFPLVVNADSQACNHEFLKAGEVSWNEGTSINISSSTHQRKTKGRPKEDQRKTKGRPKEDQRKTLNGKVLEFFLPDAFKTAFQMRYLNHR